MSFHVFFGFSVGLSKPLRVPKGTKREYLEHVAEVEKALGLKPTKYLDNPAHWDGFKRDYAGIDDRVLCDTVSGHNRWVRKVYADFGEWSKNPVKGGEKLTPEDAQEFWHGLETLHVPVARWTEDFYTERMEAAYEVMRGRETEGQSFDEKALTPKQAAAVINVFAEWLDNHHRRLDVPNGHDHLASSDDGGYSWCEKCGPSPDHDGCNKRKCPLRAEAIAEQGD